MSVVLVLPPQDEGDPVDEAVAARLVARSYWRARMPATIDSSRRAITFPFSFAASAVGDRVELLPTLAKSAGRYVLRSGRPVTETSVGSAPPGCTVADAAVRRPVHAAGARNVKPGPP